ncbi:hypothetical protein WMY93_003139 [Mugilogobius chulae]|uniref:Mediator of RNA polymerase II transcription subunit 9 n=1 Tax=Mugilogobius chulae TaxID=88201 RepID=A0AAW0PVB4_9GOBI
MMATVQPVQEKENQDWSLLPLVHDIIKCMDKDSQDVHQELAKLKSKIQEAREQISNMPGIDCSQWSSSSSSARCGTKCAQRTSYCTSTKASVCSMCPNRHDIQKKSPDDKQKNILL